mgnify:CR=1 FL=1
MKNLASMFTVETEFDHTKVVVMDDNGQRNDLIVRFTCDGVYLSQWYNLENRYHTIWLTNKMANEAIISLNSKDGTYKTNS